jgi:hypothetical protein
MHPAFRGNEIRSQPALTLAILETDIGAKVIVTALAIMTFTANDHWLNRGAITRFYFRYTSAYLRNFPCDLMPHRDREGDGWMFSFKNVQVRATQRGCFDLDQNIQIT